MEQQSTPEPAPQPAAPHRALPRALKIWYAVVAISVAAILAFSALAAFYYVQADDYRESKYRTQFQIVDEMIAFLPVENATVTVMLDTDEDNGQRRAAAFSGTRIAEMLAGDSFALAVMYDEEDERRTTFFALGAAFSGVATVLYEGYVNLSSPSHVFSDEYVTMVKTATGIMSTILGYLQQGLVADVDGITDPYHVVGHMPIASIATAAAALGAVV